MTQLAVADKAKKERIEKELDAAGVVHRNLHPFTNNYLPHILHDDEHIQAAVFGRRKESEGFFGFVEGMLVATSERVIFLDHRPGYTTMDEISYDNVSGVSLSMTVFYASVTLFTKIMNYRISFANRKSAQLFADYIESIAIQHEDKPVSLQKPAYEARITGEALKFLATHEIGVVSTVERTGALSGAVVYYALIDNYLYFMTKQDSPKAHNILNNQHAAFTVFDEPNLQTIQLQGIVEQLQSGARTTEIVTAIARPRTYADGSHELPILRTGSDMIQIYRLVPTKFDFTDYSKR